MQFPSVVERAGNAALAKVQHAATAIVEVAGKVAQAADDAARATANAVFLIPGVSADQAVGAVKGIVKTVNEGGALRDNINVGIAAEERQTEAGKQRNGLVHHTASAAGYTVVAVKAGVGMAAEAVLSTTTAAAGKIVSAGKVVGGANDGVSAAESAAATRQAVLGDLVAPKFSNCAGGAKQQGCGR